MVMELRDAWLKPEGKDLADGRVPLSLDEVMRHSLCYVPRRYEYLLLLPMCLSP